MRAGKFTGLVLTMLLAGCASGDGGSGEPTVPYAGVDLEDGKVVTTVPDRGATTGVLAEPPPPPPPAPLAVSPAEPGGSVEEMVITGSRIRRSDMDSASPVTVISKEAAEEPGRGSAGQPGTLTAGDYDDLLNADLYMTYAKGYLKGRQQQEPPFVNTAERVTVQVSDGAGRPMPFARVAVRRGDDAALVLSTAANGRVVLYPDHDRLPQQFTVEVSGPGGGASQTRAVTRGAGATTVEVALRGAAAPVRRLDLLLVVDTTGSMGDELNYLKTELDAIVAGLSRRHPGLDIRLGLIFYRDKGDQYVVRSYPFSRDVAAVRGALAQQFASGGGDYPEAMDQALAQAVGGYDWRDQSVNVALLVADAPPHPERVEATWKQAIEARRKRIHIVPVAGSGVADEAQFVMRSMAALTQGRYLFLTDDSGVGLPHAEPSVDCYLVTRLNGLIERTVDSLVAGRRVEPAQNDIVRTVGVYDKGVCRAPEKR